MSQLILQSKSEKPHGSFSNVCAQFCLLWRLDSMRISDWTRPFSETWETSSEIHPCTTIFSFSSSSGQMVFSLRHDQTDCCFPTKLQTANSLTQILSWAAATFSTDLLKPSRSKTLHNSPCSVRLPACLLPSPSISVGKGWVPGCLHSGRPCAVRTAPGCVDKAWGKAARRLLYFILKT